MARPTVHAGLRCDTCCGAVLATNEHGLSVAVLDMWAVRHDGHDVSDVNGDETAVPVDRGDDE